jgi:ribonuclease J
VAILGRSLEKSVEVSKNLGYLKIPAEVLINKKEVSSVPSEKLIIITTGSQGEPMAALSRIVRGENKKIIVEEGDTVIISAKTIPGNEKPVLKIINSLYRKEANVFYEEVSEVHVSGHASKEELKMMFNIVKPKNFIPIHGERKQLFHHAELAKEMGLSRGNIRIIEDGEMVELSSGRIKRTGKVEIKKRFIEGDSFEELEDIILHDRRRIADDGLVIVTLLVEEGTGKLVGDVEVITRGFMLLSDNEEEMEEIKKVVRERFETLEHNLRHDWEYTRPKIRSGLRTYFRKYFRSFPLVLPIILSVSKEELK